MSVGQHPPMQANQDLGGDLSEEEKSGVSDPELREWWAKKRSDPEWEKRQEEELDRRAEQLRILIRRGHIR